MTLMTAASTDHLHEARWSVPPATKEVPPSDGSGQPADIWTVQVRPTSTGQIQRLVVVERGKPARDTTCQGRCTAWNPEEVIWPAWAPSETGKGTAGTAAITSLEGVHAY